MTDSHLGWQQLVTDGHVRAARVRRIQPMLIAIAIVLMLVGWFLLGLVEPSKTENNRAHVLVGEVTRQQVKATYAFAGMPPPRVGYSKLATLPHFATLGDTQKRILTELDRADGVPKDMGIKEVTPSAFWRVPWKPGEMVTSGSGDVRVIGALVNSSIVDPDVPDLGRWLGVFRKRNGSWSAISIEAPGFVGIEGTAVVPINAIPVTLAPLLKTKE